MVIDDAARDFHAVDHRAKNVHNRSSYRALPASGFAHQSQRFALLESETYAVHRFDFGNLPREYASLYGKAHAQILHLENFHGFTRWQRTQCPGDDSISSGSIK